MSKQIKLGIACVAATQMVMSLSGCAPKPPISITEIGDSFKGIECDYDEPACKKQYETAQEEAANKMKGRVVEPFIAQITRISESSNKKNTWDVDARIAWDQADEDSSAMFSAGLLTGLVTLGQTDGGLVKESLKQPVGKCLTSPNSGYKGVAAMSIEAFEVNIKDLNGIKEGALVEISGGKVVPMGKEDGWLKTTYRIGSGNDFGKVSLGVSGPDAVLSTSKNLYKECPRRAR